MKKTLTLFFIVFIFTIPLSFHAEHITGLWENGERFIEYSAIESKQQSSDNAFDTVDTAKTSEKPYTMRVVLKPYYRFVYEPAGTYHTTAVQSDSSKEIYQLHIRYPNTKAVSILPIWIHNDTLFTSFYTQTAYEILKSFEEEPKNEADIQPNKNLLEGFWIEQGNRNGMCIYPQEAPDFLDAYFFMNGTYIKFRYWKDNEREQKNILAQFKAENGTTIGIPKFLQHSGALYSCITSNSTLLRNYEKGIYTIANEAEMQYATLTPQGGGPGSRAVGDTYPHQRFPQLNAIPLYYSAEDKTFAFGQPFLKRSAITNLDAAITEHNKLRRPPPEPLLKADEYTEQ